MLKKILQWTVFILFLLLIGLCFTVALRQHLQYDALYPRW